VSAFSRASQALPAAQRREELEQSSLGYTGAAWQIARAVPARQGAYAVASLMARYDVNDKLSVTLHVQNLFDRKHIASMSGWWYSGTYGAPRSAQVIARCKF
jgi:outer membrane receptor for ferric coprogen and ferric-rhodotorulic acid